MDTKSSKCVHLVEGGTNGSQYVNMAPMGETSLGRVIHARKRQKSSFTHLETHGDGSGYLACDACSSGVPNEVVPAGIVPIGNILVRNNIGFQTRTKGGGLWLVVCGWWSVVGLWYVDCGVWLVVRGMWSVVGLWSVVCGLWLVVRGWWSVVGLWLVCGVWCVVCVCVRGTAHCTPCSGDVPVTCFGDVPATFQ